MKYLICLLIIAGCTQVYEKDTITVKDAVNYEETQDRVAFYVENGYNEEVIWR